MASGPRPAWTERRRRHSRPDLAFVPIEGLEPVEVGLVRLREDERPVVLAIFDELTKLSAL